VGKREPKKLINMKKTVLVTGASGGIGVRIAELLSMSYEVIYAYHQNPAAIPKSARKISLNFADIADLPQQLSQLPPVDIIIHAACPKIAYHSIRDDHWSLFQEQFTVGVGGLVHLVQHFLPHMTKKKWGRIISVSSALALQVPANKLASYITGKCALLGLVKSLAVELASFGITVNTIAPGVTDTAFLDTFPIQMRQLAARQTPVGRLGTPDDVAHIAKFLCSDEAEFLTGVTIPVAGGQVM
jgi:3-oxoacyl-[acyl-carrier protein] reductase